MDSESRVVQTRLPENEYEQLRRVAEQEGLSLKDALRQAALEFTERQGKHDPSDPFFDGSVPETDDDTSLTATKTDEYLYE
ncbi:MAG: hypothetical protein ACOCYZ_05260 [Halococcoides sp.]